LIEKEKRGEAETVLWTVLVFIPNAAAAQALHVPANPLLDPLPDLAVPLPGKPQELQEPAEILVIHF
jgi:hypothetical protein